MCDQQCKACNGQTSNAGKEHSNIDKVRKKAAELQKYVIKSVRLPQCIKRIYTL